MAYAILAGLPPVYGLYTAFVFIFLFFSFFLFYENSIGGALLWFHVAVNIYVCMCVRMWCISYVCMYVCMYVWMNVYMYVWMYVNVCVCVDLE